MSSLMTDVEDGSRLLELLHNVGGYAEEEIPGGRGREAESERRRKKGSKER